MLCCVHQIIIIMNVYIFSDFSKNCTSSRAFYQDGICYSSPGGATYANSATACAAKYSGMGIVRDADVAKGLQGLIKY